MARTTTRVRAGGRIVIPAAIRAATGLRDGDDVQVEVAESGEILLIPVSGALARAQQLLAPYLSTERSLADELIAERRNAALRE
jgi:AbrB family looped-hinge helix DNA binding protein